MICVTFTMKKEEILAFTVEGHGDLADEGKDILCAAVSIYAINTINSIISLADMENFITYHATKGDLSFEIVSHKYSKEKFHDTQILLQSMKLAFLSLEDQYKNNIKVQYQEVKTC